MTDKELNICVVPNGALTRNIPLIYKYLVTAADMTNGRCAVDDIVRFFYTGLFTLWLIYIEETKEVIGFFCLEAKIYPQKKLMCIQHCTTEPGSMKDGFNQKMQDAIEAHAKANGCSGVEFVGRFGWKKYTDELGYEKECQIYQKSISEVAR